MVRERSVVLPAKNGGGTFSVDSDGGDGQRELYCVPRMRGLGQTKTKLKYGPDRF